MIWEWVNPARKAVWPLIAAAYVISCCIAAIIVWRMQPGFFLGLPAVVLLIVALSVTLSFACAGQWFVHNHFPRTDFLAHNEVGGIIMGVAGTVFGVVLGFLTVVAWQQFTDARQLVALESSAATDAWHAAVGLPYADRLRLRSDVLQYAELMVGSEWPQMRHGGVDPQADLVVMDAIATVGTIRAHSFMQSNSQFETGSN